MTKPRPHNYQTVTSQGPKVNTFLEQARSVSHIWLLGTPALQITVYTHDGESQAVLRRARQGRDAHSPLVATTHPVLSGRRIGERADSLTPALGTSGMEGGFVTDRRVDQTETGLLFC